MRISPLQVFILYILLILACALAYCFLPGIFSKPMGGLDSFYFSVVTITTLGYGDFLPISGLGKFIAASEAFLGVVLLGVFFLTVSHELVNSHERKRICAGKNNLKVQYDYWRRDIVWPLLFLSDLGNSVSSELAEKLIKPSAFREYFNENNKERWYAVANNLSLENHYTREIVRHLETLQNHIETFIAIVPIADTAILQSLTGYTNFLDRLRRLDLDNYDDQKTFMRDLWSIVALWDFITGEYDRDYLLEAIEKI
ncbi:MAG: two pore domain potassium channel family protein [Candidatus Electrothrix sp. EH2]|nr:two pore domain potassium channel family protein [Candidatus Electrothrix sp. EH2]